MEAWLLSALYCKRGQKKERNLLHIYRDFVALWETKLPNHPSGTSSERIASPEDRELGLAGLSILRKALR
jgi:hypothetical protein